jgi:signal transduction histidine kinase/ligand-binding sensor domain-containing protein
LVESIHFSASDREFMRRAIIVLAIVCFRSSVGIALDPTSHISQYGHSVWRVQDGYFGGTPTAITQTTDGYIWVRTQGGLFRFDGVRFVRWSAESGEELSSTGGYSILGARDGSLWAGTHAGLAHLVDGRLTLYEKGSRSTPLIEDRDGKIWFEHVRPGDRTHPLCQVLQGEVHCYGKEDGFDIGPGSPAMAQDASGAFWIGSDRALVRWRPNSPESSKMYRPQTLQSNPGETGVSGITCAADGSVWVGIAFPGKGGGLQHLVNNTLKPFIAPKLNGETLMVIALLSDHQENLWVGTLHGLYKIRGKNVDLYGTAEGLSSDVVRRIFEDREGNIWVATSGGLDMFRDLRVKSISTGEGLHEDTVESVAAARDGRVWVGTSRLQVLEPGGVSLDTEKALPGNQVTSLFVDRADRLWTGMDDKLFVREGGRFHQITKPNGSALGMIFGIAEDSDRNIWVETKGPPGTLVRIRGLKIQEMFPAPGTPLAREIVADPQQGIWLGLVTGDLARFQAGRVRTFNFGEHPNSRVAITAGSDGSILGGTSFGIVAWKDGKQQILSKENGLPCDYVTGLITDDAGNFWLFAQCGLIEIPRDQMQQWWEHPESKLNLRVFDTFDGFRPGLGHFNTSAKTPDGRLWFANGSVLQVIDPAHVSRNIVPPPVKIRALVADHREYPMDSGIKLPALTRDLEIDYTALSYAAPQKVLFRYMLEGRDSGFQEAGTRRQAFYNDLRPGPYRFRVIACNNDGVWNEVGASLGFSVLPAYYQTTWFRVSCVAVFLMLLWGIYRLRIRQLQHQFAIGLEARVNERTRIARELHDTLLQSFHGLMLHFQTGIDLLPGHPVDARKTLEIAINRADQAINDGRDAVQGLRASVVETNDLVSAVRILGEELEAADTNPNSAVFEVEVEGAPRNLHPIFRDEVYRIAAEALRNAFRHAQAQRIEVEVLYGERWLRLRVRDDGKGIDPKFLSGDGRAKHYGLHGMRERAQLVGGKLAVWSKLDSGTEVELSIPASTAYATSSRSRSWLSEKFSDKGMDAKETDVKETKIKS